MEISTLVDGIIPLLHIHRLVRALDTLTPLPVKIHGIAICVKTAVKLVSLAQVQSKTPLPIKIKNNLEVEVKFEHHRSKMIIGLLLLLEPLLSELIHLR